MNSVASKPSTTKKLSKDAVQQIQTTTTYGQFKLMTGNRPVDYNHVKRLMREMQAYPNMFASKPIEVNEDMYIIDGQHRRQAAAELGMPVYYIVVPGGTLEETRIGNVTQRRWTLLDFANSFAQSGRKDYVTFLRVVKKYPKIAPSILRTYLVGGQLHEMDVDFRRGNFVVADETKALKNIDKLNAIIEKTGITVNAPMANGLLSLFEGRTAKNADPFDFEFFMQKLERESARELLRTASSVRACLRSVEDVYNFQSKTQKRLY